MAEQIFVLDIRALADEFQIVFEQGAQVFFPLHGTQKQDVFAGDYGAGYYSYKWAEVLSADAFSLFEERGLFDRDTGRAFRETALEQGGSCDAMELYMGFRGREPTIDALLRYSGIAA